MLPVVFQAEHGLAQQLPGTFETGKHPITVIHVDPGGDDEKGDGTAGSPYATIGRAVENAAAGTAIRIHEGTYPGGTVVRQLAGTRSRPIWIGGAPGEHRPVIEGGDEGLYLDRVRYLVAHDLVIRNAKHNGINAADGGNFADPDATRHIIFRDIEIRDIGGSGNHDCLKLSGVDDYMVTRSVFERCGAGGTAGSGIDQVGCHNGEVTGNYFASMGGNAIQAKGGSENIRIHGNTIVDGGYRAVNIGGSTARKYFRPPLSRDAVNVEASNIRVTANVIVGAGVPFAFVGAVKSTAANNTIIEPGHWLIAILQATTSSEDFDFGASGNNRVANNLFFYARSALSEPIHIGDHTKPDSFEFAGNLWFAHDDVERSRPALPVAEAGGVAGRDPGFRDLNSGDYRLREDSPAIGRGHVLPEPVLDHDGRPYGRPPSIGAYEAKSRSSRSPVRNP
jgi:hypothetical protein